MTNVIPINDLEEHTLNSTCKCKPRVEIGEDGTLLVFHNSFDHREEIEDLGINNSNHSDYKWQVVFD